MGRNSKVDWTDNTWNPIVGCYKKCPYCYAERIANRFAGHIDLMDDTWSQTKCNGYEIYDVKTLQLRNTNGKVTAGPYPFGFKPTFLRYKLDEPQQWKSPKTVFVGSMTDMLAEWIPDSWILKVFEACRQAPQHTYMFLTKNPARYIHLIEHGLLPDDENINNMWFGTTITTNDDPYFFVDEKSLGHPFNGFLSIEPLHSDFNENLLLREHSIKWVIIGAETGNRIGKITPKREWVKNIVNSCDKCAVPVFMKTNIWDVIPDAIRTDFPF